MVGLAPRWVCVYLYEFIWIRACAVGAGPVHQRDLHINPEVISLVTLVSWQFGGPSGGKKEEYKRKKSEKRAPNCQLS